MTTIITAHNEPLNENTLITKLSALKNTPTTTNVWIGRNLEIIENNWFQRLVLYFFGNFDWCKDHYNVDYKETKELLGRIKALAEKNVSLFNAFNAAVQPIKAIAPDFAIDKAVVGSITDQDYQNFKNQLLQTNMFLSPGLHSTRLTLSNKDLLSPILLDRILQEYPQLNEIVFFNCANLTPDFLKVIGEKYHTQIKTLWFSGPCALQDDDFIHLKNLSLEAFVLEGSEPLTSGALRHLNCSNLQHVLFRDENVHVHNEDMKYLTNSKLTNFSSDSSDLTATGIQHLLPINTLKGLTLHNSLDKNNIKQILNGNQHINYTIDVKSQ